jgi:beta-lactamase class A
MDAVNRRMAALGTTTFTLQRRMMDEAAAAAGAENLSSAADLVLVMDAIRRGEGLTPTSRDAALEILRRPNPTALRAAVPDEVAVASKPGGLDGVRTEVAFVDVKGRPYVMAVMTSFLADEADGSRAITDVSREAYRYFNRLARAGREGRLR